MLCLTIEVGHAVRLEIPGFDDVTILVAEIRTGRGGGKQRAKLLFGAPQNIRIRRDDVREPVEEIPR